MSDERDPWGQDNRYQLIEWRAEVENDETRLGYWAWVDHKRGVAA